MLVAMPERSPTVYLIQCQDLVKIGTTGNLNRRMEELQKELPSPAKLLAAGPGGLTFERRLHSRYAAWRKHGEWFQLTENQIQELIPVVQSGMPKVQCVRCKRAIRISTIGTHPLCMKCQEPSEKSVMSSLTSTEKGRGWKRFAVSQATLDAYTRLGLPPEPNWLIPEVVVEEDLQDVDDPGTVDPHDEA